MTILASHFALVLGAWRLRVRIDIDEPRDDEFASVSAASARQDPATAQTATHMPARGRG